MKILKKICPICALVSLTWLSLLIAKQFGYGVDDGLLAMLMGGSAVGLSYTLANRLSDQTMIWKLVSIPVGFIAMYALFYSAWGYFLLAGLGYWLVWALFKGQSSAPPVRVTSEDNIKKELNNCC